MDWTDKFRSVITDRLGITADEYNEIRFNLMAVVPDRRLAIQHKLKMLRTNKQIVLDALQHLLKIREKNTTNCGSESGGNAKSDSQSEPSNSVGPDVPEEHKVNIHCGITLSHE